MEKTFKSSSSAAVLERSMGLTLKMSYAVIFSISIPDDFLFRKILHVDHWSQREEMGEDERKAARRHWLLPSLLCLSPTPQSTCFPHLWYYMTSPVPSDHPFPSLPWPSRGRLPSMAATPDTDLGSINSDYPSEERVECRKKSILFPCQRRWFILIILH